MFISPHLNKCSIIITTIKFNFMKIYHLISLVLFLIIFIILQSLRIAGYGNMIVPTWANILLGLICLNFIVAAFHFVSNIKKH